MLSTGQLQHQQQSIQPSPITPSLTYHTLDQPTQEHYSSLWSWYIISLALGHYETINKDIVNLREMDHFITQFNSDTFNSTCILFILPLLKFNEDEAYLKSVLTCYYKGEVPQGLEVTPLGLITKDEIIIMVKDQGSPELRGGIEECLEQDLNSIISGDPGFVSSIYTEKDKLKESLSVVSSVDSFRMRDSISSDVDSEDDDDDDDDDGMSRLGASLERVATINDGSIMVNDNECASQSEDFDEDEEEEEDDILLPYPSKISLENTIPGVSTSQPPYDPESESSSSSVSGSSANNDINLSIIIFKNLQNNLKKVAIRQLSESNEFTNDWILYDDEFNFKNLQLLSLSEIFELNSSSSKILIYSNLNYGKILNPSPASTPTATNNSAYTTIQHTPTSTYSYCDNHEYESDTESLDSQVHENDLTVREFDGSQLQPHHHHQGGLFQTNSLHSYADSENNTIKFVQSFPNSITTQPTSIDLSRSETQSQLKSIKSELHLGNTHASWAKGNVLSKSKSNPNTVGVGTGNPKKAVFSIGKRFRNKNQGNGIVKIRSHGQVGGSAEGDQKCSIM